MIKPIGIFDSGFGGLTILDSIRKALPRYDYVYLGDNARAPYGNRSFDVVYEFTLEAVRKLVEDLHCPLVILGCNTASAKALRTIQQTYIKDEHPDCRVLGIIRPTAEIVGTISKTKHIGVLATEGTIRSHSYEIEIGKLWDELVVREQAAKMWVPLVENGEYDSDGADYFVKDSIDKLLKSDPMIDTILLACTHYPLLMDKIKRYVRDDITIVPQGRYVAESLKSYLVRHRDIDEAITKNGLCEYYTTESEERFREAACTFLHDHNITAQRIAL